MPYKRICGGCKHFKILPNCPEIGVCAKDNTIPFHSFDDRCDYREPYGFEPKDGEQDAVD